MTQAITPQEALGMKSFAIPAFVLEAFNELIAKNLTGSKYKSATVKQDDVVELIVGKAAIRGYDEITRREVFDRHWLDIEPIYEQSGWKVVYDKPAYCESYPATFTFTAKE